MWPRKSSGRWTTPSHPQDQFTAERHWRRRKRKEEGFKTIQLDESESEQDGSDEAEVNTTTEFSDQGRESEDSDADSTYLGQWEKSLKNIELQLEQEPCHILK